MVGFISQDCQRRIDGAHTPNEKEITDFIGEPAKTVQTAKEDLTLEMRL
jgi:hypothetical protein